MFLRGILLQTFLVIVASFVLTTVESQMVSIYPPSLGAQRGEQNVVLNCNVTGLPANNHIQWIYYPTWQSTGFTIYSTYSNVTNDPGNFTVYPLTAFGNTHSLDLVIKTVKPELATIYTCNLTPVLNVGRSVQVIALDPMECPNNGTIEYDDGNEANISCSVNYYESLSAMVPNITWYRDGQLVPGGAVTIIESPTRKTARLVKNVTSADDDKKLVCIVHFANSTPDYTDNCSTVVYVIHSVSEISFNPPSSVAAPTIAVGETINCTANGRPAPTIEWYDNQKNVLSEWSELNVTDDMRSWAQPITLYCRANNTIDNGQTFAYVEGNYTFNVAGADHVVTSGGTVVAAAPIVGFGGVVMAIVLVYLATGLGSPLDIGLCTSSLPLIRGNARE